MLEWYVYCCDINRKKVCTYNIFSHAAFNKTCVKAAKEYKNDRDSFMKEIRWGLRYLFGSRCEWEILIQLWPPHISDTTKKVDVADQVIMNWSNFADYIWNNRSEL